MWDEQKTTWIVAVKISAVQVKPNYYILYLFEQPWFAYSGLLFFFP